jgi:predicted PurR-regulated permease PerM
MNLNLSTSTRWGFSALILLALSIALYQGRLVLIPTVIAMLLAAMLWPAVQWLNARFHMPWSLACSSMVAVLVVLVAATAVAFSLAVPKIVQQLPNDPKKSQEVYEKFRYRLEGVSARVLKEE